jgi:hypothetical protein
MFFRITEQKEPQGRLLARPPTELKISTILQQVAKLMTFV